MSYKYKKLGSEAVMSFLVLIVLALLIHPYWMPMGLVVVCIALLAVLVFGLGVFVWRERSKDEREYHIIAQTGRAAYMVGGAVMALGVAVQTLEHQLDLWLVFGLAGMMITKIISGTSKYKM